MLWVPAHLGSFAIATLVNYFVKLRPALLASGRGSSLRLHALLLVASLMTLFLRGGLLGLLTQQLGWPAQLAIVPAVLAGVGVSLVANDLLLSPILSSRGQLLRRLAVVIPAYALLLRLLYIGQVELLPEETYYWNYWQHPDLGYLDHPPMVAWLIGLGTNLCGDSELGVRLGALFTQALATLFAYRLTRNLFGPQSALVAVLLLQVLPFYFLSGMLMTPDAPLLAAWAGCLYFLERALIAGRARAWWGVGVCLGLGLLSKYTIGLLVPATLLFVLLDPAARRWLLRWQPYAALAVALAIFSPVIFWNAQHHWASFAFQTSHRLGEPPRFSLHILLLSVMVLLTPVGFASLPGILSRPMASEPAQEDSGRVLRFTQIFVLVPLAVFVVFSLRHQVKLDWTGALWLAAVPALAGWIAASAEAQAGRSRLRAAWLPTGITALLLYGAGLHHLALGLPGLGYSQQMELLPVGWRQLGLKINELAAQIQRDEASGPLVVGMDRYVLASELAFYAPEHAVSVNETTSEHLFGHRLGLMYEDWFPLERLRGRTLLLVAWKPEDLAPQRLEPHIGALQPLQSLALTRNGKLIRHLYYRIARDYRPPVPESKPDAS